MPYADIWSNGIGLIADDEARGVVVVRVVADEAYVSGGILVVGGYCIGFFMSIDPFDVMVAFIEVGCPFPINR